MPSVKNKSLTKPAFNVKRLSLGEQQHTLPGINTGSGSLPPGHWSSGAAQIWARSGAPSTEGHRNYNMTRHSEQKQTTHKFNQIHCVRFMCILIIVINITKQFSFYAIKIWKKIFLKYNQLWFQNGNEILSVLDKQSIQSISLSKASLFIILLYKKRWVVCFIHFMFDLFYINRLSLLLSHIPYLHIPPNKTNTFHVFSIISVETVD